MSEGTPSPEVLFAAALECAGAVERRAFLDEACAGNAALRQEVESLLAASEQAGKFMNVEAINATLPPTEKAGDRIGRYKLLEQIGEGGFGVVWMAEQEEPVRRRVALKIIKLGMDTREVVARFEAERQALAMMDHTNIASVFDGGATDAGRPYFVMELVKGIPITQFCDERKLSTRERLELFMQVCQAVQHAHQKGVIHRDIKPTNVLVTVKDDRPVPKVIDFGVAKATQARLTEKTLFTRFHQWIGTPAYMSPEQAGLGSLDADTRSDIYSLGVLLYELLTGHTPFDTQKLLATGFDSVMRTIREEEPPKPSTRITEDLVAADVRRLTSNSEARGPKSEADRASLRRLLQEVRGDLDWIVMKALEKDRQRRYDTANALARDVEHHLNSEPVNAAAPTLSYQFQKFLLRHRKLAAWTATCALLLITGTVVSVWQAVRADRARVVAEKREAEARDNLWASYLAAAHASRNSGLVGRRFATLEAVAKAVAIRPSPELRSEAASALDLLDVRVVREWEGRLPGTTEIVLDRRFERYASNNGPGHVSVRRVSDDRELLSFQDRLAPERFSPDGRFLLGIDSQPPRLGVWDLDKGQLVVQSSMSVYCPGPDFHPHAPILAACGAAGTVEFFDLVAGKRWSWPAANLPPGAIRFRPDGRQIALASLEPPLVRVYDVESGDLVASLVHSNGVRRVDWSPDGHWLAAPCSDGRILLWNMRDGATLDCTLAGHSDVVNAVCFDPQGEFLLSHSYDSTTALWSLASRSLLLKLPDGDYSLSFSANGRWLGPYVTGCTVRLFELERGSEHRILPAKAVTECNGTFSPDGGWVVIGGDGVQCWEVGSGQRQWIEPVGHVRYVTFRPDGATLLTLGETGAREWPWSVEPVTGRPRLGSPRRLTTSWGTQAEYSRDGSVLVISQRDGLWVSDARSPAPQVLPMPMCNFASVSPDGRWAAASSWDGIGMKVWEAATGREVFTLPKVYPTVGFTPNGRWLILGRNDVFRCLEVGTWRTVADRTPENLNVFIHALSAESRWVAVEQGRRGRIAFYELPTLSPLFTLDSAGGFPVCFSRDNALLLTRRPGGDFGLWNLRRMRDELAPLGLAW